MLPLILSIESSCDDTSAAVMQGKLLLSNVVASQQVHKQYGGVVPELASRAHLQNIVPVVHQALAQAGVKKEDLNAVAFTRGPGLMGSLVYELLNMVMEGNNFREFDTAIFFKWIFKALCGIILISHTTDIIIGIFSLGNDITIGALNQVTDKDMLSLDVNTVASQINDMLVTDHKADWGVLIVFLMFSFVMFLVMLVSLVIVMLVVISRLIEAFMYIAVAPIPMSTFMNKEWGTIGTNWLRNLMALAFQGLFIVVALGVFQAMFVSSVQDLIDNSKDTTKMYLSMVNCIVWAVALCFTIFKSSSISKSVFNAH
ncbi:MAG: hypothetical protein II495_03125 [Paludibacteraceae bacterium]|nr:hypothetical protein [Paludibacteraceae bacterium]